MTQEMVIKRLLSVFLAGVFLLGIILPARAQGAPPGVELPPGSDGAPRDELAVMSPYLMGLGDTVRVVVELEEPPAAAAIREGESASATALRAQTQLARVRSGQEQLTGRLVQAGIASEQLFRVDKALNAVALETRSENLAALRGVPGVKAIHPLTAVTLTNESSVPLTGALTAWQTVSGGANLLGQGVRIGIVDTGIDYTHKVFGGVGTVGAYLNNNPGVVEPGTFPTGKVVGGYDFAGDGYDASGEGGSRVPTPDADPLDCNGHGTAVAATAAGTGLWFSPRERPAATQFPQFAAKPATVYREEMGIGTGMAPLASLYALKIFGCGGSSELMLPALDWALDPNRDGNLNDRLDVLNLSFGTPMGVVDSAVESAINQASQAGMLVVAAAGNSGDVYFMTNSPGTATRAIAVAASQDGALIGDAIQVTEPGQPPFFVGASRATAYPWAEGVTITGPLLYLGEGVSSGCSLFPGGVFMGKVALLDWTTRPDGQPECSSGQRVANALAAGAMGVVFLYDRAPLEYSITGLSNIPSVIVSQSHASLLRSLPAGSQVSFSREFNGWELDPYDPAKEDLILASSSRGPRRGDSALKPDITAPGGSIFSALARSGTLGFSASGTSMAAPHVSGALALLRQLHPDWTAEELKALVMVTATQDVAFPTEGGNLPGAPDRSGTGRLSVDQAVRSPLVAYSLDQPGAVAVSFGEVQVLDDQAGADLVQDRSVRLANKSSTALTANLGFASRYPANPGVAYALLLGGVPLLNPVTLPAGGTLELTIRQSIDASGLQRVADPAADSSVTLSGITYPREFITQSGGFLTISLAAGGMNLRLPVYAVHRAVGARQAVSPTFALGSTTTGTRTIVMGGQALPVALERPVVQAFELLLESPAVRPAADPAAAADLLAVGVTSDYQRSLPRPPLESTNLHFGLATYQPWSSPHEVEFQIYLDTDEDAVPEWVLFNGGTRLFTGRTTDLFLSVICPYPFPRQEEIPYYCSTRNTLNADFRSPWGKYSSNPFYSNVMDLTVPAAWMGLTTQNLDFQFLVETWSRGIPGQVDSTGWLQYRLDGEVYNLNQPVTNLPLAQDDRDLQLRWNLNHLVLAGGEPRHLLLLHHHNGGNQAEIVRMSPNYVALTWDDRGVLAVEPGQSGLLQLHLTNRSGKSCTFNLQSSVSPSGWQVTMPARVTVPSGASVPFSGQVQAPSAATVGSSATVSITAVCAEDNAIQASAQVPVRAAIYRHLPFIGR